MGILDRMSEIYEMPLSIEPGQSLQIVVENMGRIHYGPHLNDFKGIISNVTLNGVPLINWVMSSMPLNKRKHLHCPKTTNAIYDRDLFKSLLKTDGSMAFYTGHFNGCKDGVPRDTFLDMSGWKKGVAFINKHNIGMLKTISSYYCLIQIHNFSRSVLAVDGASIDFVRTRTPSQLQLHSA